MKTRSKGLIIAGAVVAVLVVFLVARGVIRGNKARTAAAAQASAVTTVKVTRGSLTSSITASGQLQPSTITTIRPDSNMPTRKLVKLLVKEGQRVATGQALAEIDPSGLDLDLKSAQASLQSQKLKLANLQARPAGLDTAAAQAGLASAKSALDGAQESYDNAKDLVDKGLASKSTLTDADRALQVAKSAYASSQLSYQNTLAQNPDADIQAQQAVVSTAQADLQKAQLIYDSATIRSPVAGVVAEVSVNIGDLVGPSTALMTVVDPDPMWLQAQVNENDMVQLKIGQAASVTPSGYPDLVIRGRVIQIDLHAQVQSNVSVFTATIEVPNRDGKLLWGMNADADISVLSLQNVLTLPTTAIKTSNGTSTVTILDAGQPVSWEVQTGATDGTRTEIVAGLDEGTEVVLTRKTAASTAAGARQGGPGFGGVFGILR
jgi:HlyD family secretion protein